MNIDKMLTADKYWTYANFLLVLVNAFVYRFEGALDWALLASILGSIALVTVIHIELKNEYRKSNQTAEGVD